MQLGLNVALKDGRVRVIKEDGTKVDVSDIQFMAAASGAGAATQKAMAAAVAAAPQTASGPARPSTSAAAPATSTAPPPARSPVEAILTGDHLNYTLTCAVTADIPPAPQTQPADAEANKPGAAASTTQAQGPAHVELKVNSAAAVGPSGNAWAVNHTTTFTDVVMTRDKDVIKPGKTVVVTNLLFDQNARTAVLKGVAVSSDFMGLQVIGNVDKYDTEGRADLSGDFWGDGKLITQQVRALTGKNELNLDMDPQQRHQFHVAGPLRQPEKWQMDGLSGQAQVGWNAFSYPPIQAGALNLVLLFKGNTIVIQPTSMPVNKGDVNLAGMIVLTDAQGKVNPVLHLKEYTAVVDKLALDQTVSTEVLSHINPAAFYRPQSISGTTTVHLQDVDMPLSGQATRTGKIGKGRVDFNNLIIEPRKDSVMANLLGLLGAGKAGGVGSVEIPGADFRMSEGRIYYDNFKMVWKNLYNLKFSGSVGLDGSVDLTVGVPVTPDLIKQVIELPPLPGAAEKVVQSMGETYIPVKISGSRDNMQMDKGGLMDAVKKAVQGLLKSPQGAASGLEQMFEGAGKGVGGLLGGLTGQGKQEAPPSQPQGQQQPQKSQPLQELQGLFRKPSK